MRLGEPGHHQKGGFVTAARNCCMMRALARIAAAFSDVGIPLMVLKGAALNLTVYRQPHARPMGDLDLFIKPEHVEDALALLEGLGCLRGEPLVREDFFPRFYYECELKIGQVYPIKIDLHVRPFRPLRYSRLVPDEAFWARADSVRIGAATVLIPSTEEMLIHLAAHSAIHGNARPMWLEDLRHWVAAHRGEIDWERFLDTVRAWGLALPVRQAVRLADERLGEVCPPDVAQRLLEMHSSWRDRLALWQAPRDSFHPVMHVAVNVLCTPCRRFTLDYLMAVMIPDRGHMEVWYNRRHWAWLPCAHALRWCWPVVKHFHRLWGLPSSIEVRRSRIHGSGVFATCDIKTGATIARYRGKPTDRDGPYVCHYEAESGHMRRYEVTGKLMFLNHSCTPNAELSRSRLVALRPIGVDEEITIDYGDGSCNCRFAKPEARAGSASGPSDKSVLHGRQVSGHAGEDRTCYA